MIRFVHRQVAPNKRVGYGFAKANGVLTLDIYQEITDSLPKSWIDEETLATIKIPSDVRKEALQKFASAARREHEERKALYERVDVIATCA
jgi:hypothetical protein